MNGTPYAIGDREFTVPRLRVAAYERAVLAIQLSEKVPAAEDPFGLKRLDAICGAIVDLLRENHPDLKLEYVKELVRLEELDGVLVGLLKAGGKKQAPPGEGAGP